jgi:peptidoglycan hydrolase CwlO-like protein
MFDSSNIEDNYVNQFTVNLNISEIILVFICLFVFGVSILSIRKITTWLKNEFAKNKLSLYTTIVIFLGLVIIYKDNLLNLITDPPNYVFLLGVFIYALNSVYSNYKDRTENQKVLTTEQVNSVRSEVNSLKKEVNSLKKEVTGKFDSVKTEFSKLEKGVKTEVNGVKTEVSKLEKQTNNLQLITIAVLFSTIILVILVTVLGIVGIGIYLK